MTTNVFNFKGMNSADMKGAYKKLALVNHPDRGGDLEKMKTLNAEYAFWYARAATSEVKDTKTKEKPDSASYYARTYNDVFAAALEKKIAEILANGIYSHDDLTVELCGVFIWISGDTLKTDEALRNRVKACSFTFQGQKKAWWWTATSTAGTFRTNTTLNQVRAKYGSQMIKGNQAAVSAD